MHAELNRQGHRVARCTVARLMRTAGLRGISRTKGPRTTIPGAGPDTRPDLVQRAFTATAPDQLWVADITYCRTFAGWVYAASSSTSTPAGWSAGSWRRTCAPVWPSTPWRWGCGPALGPGRDTTGVIAHSDKGVQYLAVRYTQRLAEAGAVASVGSTGDSYDNALVEAFNSLFKAELVRNKGPWRSIDDLEIAVAEYIDWSTTDACTARSAWCHRPSQRTTTTGTTPPRLPSARQFRASTELGARQHPRRRRRHRVRTAVRPGP